MTTTETERTCGFLPPAQPPRTEEQPAAPATRQPLPLPGGGFDTCDRALNPIGWGVSGDANAVAVVNVAADRVAGLGSLRLTTPSTRTSVSSDRMLATAGVEYELRATARVASGQPPEVLLQFTDFDRADLGTYRTAPAASGDWETVTLTATAPEGTAQLAVFIVLEESAGTSHWDAVTVTAAPPAYDPALGTARELFLDDHRVESASGVGRVVHPAAKHPHPVLEPDQPWERSAYVYGSVHVVDGVYRMWYTAANDVPPGYFLCYAESTDGLTWTKPLGRGDVGYEDIPASRTNIVLAGGGTVAYNPSAPADRRYALLNFQAGEVNETLGYYAWFSPDGYQWQRAQERPVLLDGDVSNVTWDARTGQYVATVKKRMFTSRTPGVYDRSAFVATSEDFVHWSVPRLAVSGDSLDDGAAGAIGGLEGQVYGMPVLPYESGYVGLPWLFLVTDYTTGHAAGAGDGPITPCLASSRDLVRWQRTTRDPVLPPGGPGSWDRGTVYTASNAVVDDTSVTVYYGGFDVWHGGTVTGDPDRATQVGRVGLARWRRDGFVSLSNATPDGSGDPGLATTRPVAFGAGELHVNAVAHRDGWFRVEVRDADTNAPLAGFDVDAAVPVTGDHLDTVVRWTSEASLTDLSGRRVRFRFHLRNADLYSFWVSP